MIDLEMTEQQKAIGNQLYKFLMKQEGFTTKETMCKFLGWEYNSSNDRKLRNILSFISKKAPLIAPSNGKGYYIARKREDLELVAHEVAELKSRIELLNERLKPLQNYVRMIDNQKMF